MTPLQRAEKRARHLEQFRYLRPIERWWVEGTLQHSESWLRNSSRYHAEVTFKPVQEIK